MNQLSGLLRETLHAAYGVYFAAVFLVFAPIALLAVTVTPGLTARRRIARAAARGVFATAGMGPDVEDAGGLPEDPCVVVANHASYLDGIILCAVLPPRFTFVIKSEMQRVPLAHFLLRRIGAEFVERFHHGRSTRDARRILKRADSGHSLAFFPEGTFHREPGLHRFRAGAFTAAARTGVPVVPAVIHGSRHAMPASRILPRPRRLRVTLLEPIDSAAHRPADLAAMSRRRILERLDEPDLHPEAGKLRTAAGRSAEC